MRLKRLLSLALAAALTVGLLCFPASAASSVFPDVTDPQVADHAEFLRLVGVTRGDQNGNFRPASTLTRAEFCAMAIRALGREGEETAQRGRVIYLDVKGNHWARGYINLASTITLGGADGAGGVRLVSGVGDGTFRPDRAITCGEAVTILCRLLGYGAGDLSTGGAWYDGALSVAAAIGLTDGLSLSGNGAITRAQAAALFYNLYFTCPKGSQATYLSSLGGREEEGILLDVDATAADGISRAVRTTSGVYKTGRALDPALEGTAGTAILDGQGCLLAFRPAPGTSSRTVTALSAQAVSLTTAEGEKLAVAPETTVYRGGKETTWAAAYLDLKPSAAVTFHYAADGSLSHLTLSAAGASTAALVARAAPNGRSNPFAALAGGGSYTMYKNGLPAAAADLRQYDVATWDAVSRAIQVSDLKLTGVYENAAPSPDFPLTVTVMGKEFPVLSSARDDLTAFKIGDRVTLLLTVDDQIAGVVAPSTAKSSAVGVASVSGDRATVTLLQGGLTVSGTVSEGQRTRCDGQLVTVTSSAAGSLNLSLISGSAAPGDLNVSARTLGNKAVAANVAVFDRVKGGALVPVDYASLPTAVSRYKISFVGYDYAGRIRYLVLDDATGDAYDYGFFAYTPSSGGEAVYDEHGEVVDYTEFVPATLCVRQADAQGAETTTPAANFIGSARSGVPGGVAYNASGKLAATVTLEALTRVSRAAIDPETMTVTVAGVAYPIAENVQCYNKAAKVWFQPGKAGLEAARAYSATLTLYYDRSPDDGGKIRLIVAG